MTKWSVAFSLFVLVSSSCCQSDPVPPAPSANKTTSPAASPALKRKTPDADCLERCSFKFFFADQRDIFLSPFHLKMSDAKWLAPAATFTGLALAYDPEISHRLAYRTLNGQKRSQSLSNYGVAALAGVSGSAYLWGLWRKDDHAREAGFIAGLAGSEALTFDQGLKLLTRRDRPFQGDGQGEFFQQPAKFPNNSSFPSGHSILAWSTASVLAHEYPGPLTKIAVYGLASAVSVARVTGKQHFTSDVLVGSIAGWWIGTHAYNQHHRNRDDGSNLDIGTFTKDPLAFNPNDLSSSYVPLDSWVYAAFDRVAAMGYTPSSFQALRPWTRNECARLVQEISGVEQRGDERASDFVQSTLRSLSREFSEEIAARGNRGVARRFNVDEVYGRVMVIGREPMADGYHFGQTIYNDYGRPYWTGTNLVAGFGARAQQGHWSAYVRAEYDYAPGRPVYSDQARTAIAFADVIRVPAAGSGAAISRPRFLDAYGSYTNSGWQFTFGKQSLWWGPGQEQALNFANNADPVTMFRVDRVSPATLPGILGLLGPLRMQMFIGRLSGQSSVRNGGVLFGPGLNNQPFLHGEKFSFKPTENLELGFSETTIFGGPGSPLTLRTIFRSYGISNTVPGQRNDPGDRRAGFDFRYKLPFLRRSVTLFSDSMAEDEISPIAYPRRSAIAPGIYLSSLPFAKRLDFRAEAAYTDLPGLKGSGVYYFNTKYLSGYTNRGQLLASPVGRQGRALLLQSTYWWSPVKRIEVQMRRFESDKAFIGGGEQRQWKTTAYWELGRRVDLRGSLQYETWSFPALQMGRHSDTTSMIQLSWRNPSAP